MTALRPLMRPGVLPDWPLRKVNVADQEAASDLVSL